MNQWQEAYCKMHHNGKMPRSKSEKESVELLGQIKSVVIVEFPERTGINGVIPAHTEEYIVTENECNIPEGIISIDVLVSNLKLWLSRGQKIQTR